GGLGPWLPYQLFATGWVGLGAGLVGMHRQERPSRRDVIMLTVVGALSGYGFGIAMDLWNWAFFSSSPALGFHAGMSLSVALSHFIHYYLVTSLLYDTFRAGGNAVMVLAIGLPIITALARIRTRLRVEVETMSTAPRTISPSP
ncbi:MAG: ECF transporter S component, partial [Acidimicrobiales bacterium]